jgi:hypothetical protein
MLRRINCLNDSAKASAVDPAQPLVARTVRPWQNQNRLREQVSRLACLAFLARPPQRAHAATRHQRRASMTSCIDVLPCLVALHVPNASSESLAAAASETPCMSMLFHIHNLLARADAHHAWGSLADDCIRVFRLHLAPLSTRIITQRSSTTS